MNLKDILEYQFFNVGDVHISLWHLIVVIFIYLVTRSLVWAIWRVMGRYLERRKVDRGRRFAFRQFLRYILYTVAILMMLETIGIKLSVLWGGAAALLVGVGLGLQQTFNDLVSGIILLIEGSVEVGDVIYVNGLVGRVKSINVRTSLVETRDGVSILIPNSKIVGENAINWSHSSGPVRFQIDVGVSYASDTKKVEKLLLEAANNHALVLKKPHPQVQFKNFGNSSLDFQLHFFCIEYLQIEFIKSDLRHQIMELFRTNGIEIPFPQRDLWLKNAEVLGMRK